MSEPLILIPGIAADRTAWEGMPAGDVMTSDAATIPGMAEDILARAPERFALAGWSMGGYVALAMIASAPARIARLALLSTTAAPESEAQRAARAATMVAAAADPAAARANLLRAMLHRDARGNPAVAGPLAAMLARCAAETLARHQRAASTRPDARPGLARIAVPTLVLAGADDRIVPPAGSVQLAAAIPGARLTMIPDCGHVPQLERVETTRAALEAWLGW